MKRFAMRLITDRLSATIKLENTSENQHNLLAQCDKLLLKQ